MSRLMVPHVACHGHGCPGCNDTGMVATAVSTEPRLVVSSKEHERALDRIEHFERLRRAQRAGAPVRPCPMEPPAPALEGGEYLGLQYHSPWPPPDPATAIPPAQPAIPNLTYAGAPRPRLWARLRIRKRAA